MCVCCSHAPRVFGILACSLLPECWDPLPRSLTGGLREVVQIRPSCMCYHCPDYITTVVVVPVATALTTCVGVCVWVLGCRGGQAAISPDTFFHLGGDEVDQTCWQCVGNPLAHSFLCTCAVTDALLLPLVLCLINPRGEYSLILGGLVLLRPPPRLLSLAGTPLKCRHG